MGRVSKQKRTHHPLPTVLRSPVILNAALWPLLISVVDVDWAGAPPMTWDDRIKLGCERKDAEFDMLDRGIDGWKVWEDWA